MAKKSLKEKNKALRLQVDELERELLISHGYQDRWYRLTNKVADYFLEKGGIDETDRNKGNY